MNCLEAQEQLQHRLDGDSAPDSAAVERHLSECGPCRELFAAAALFLEGLKSLPRSPITAALTKRIVASVDADRRLRIRSFRVRVAITAALAASLLLTALAGFLWLPAAQKSGPAPNLARKDDKQRPESPPAIAKSMDDARLAVKSLTERLADQTAQQAMLLVAAATPADLGPLVSGPAVPEAADAAQTLRYAGQGLSDGLEPVTRSTRRALQFFVREVAGFESGQD